MATEVSPPRSPRQRPRGRLLRGGVPGNERLTALAGAVLFLLLAAEGATILNVHALVTAHIVIGMVVVAAVALKLASTGWRFTHYYAGDTRYRESGPPHPFMRLLAPVLVVLTASVLATGIMLAVLGPERGPWLFLHKASFVLWFAITSLHVLVYMWRVPGLIVADLRARAARRSGSFVPGRWARISAVVVALAAGALLAGYTAHLANPWHSFVHVEGGQG